MGITPFKFSVVPDCQQTRLRIFFPLPCTLSFLLSVGRPRNFEMHDTHWFILLSSFIWVYRGRCSWGPSYNNGESLMQIEFSRSEQSFICRNCQKCFKLYKNKLKCYCESLMMSLLHYATKYNWKNWGPPQQNKLCQPYPTTRMWTGWQPVEMNI